MSEANQTSESIEELRQRLIEQIQETLILIEDIIPPGERLAKVYVRSASGLPVTRDDQPEQARVGALTLYGVPVYESAAVLPGYVILEMKDGSLKIVRPAKEDDSDPQLFPF